MPKGTGRGWWGPPKGDHVGKLKLNERGRALRNSFVKLPSQKDKELSIETEKTLMRKNLYDPDRIKRQDKVDFQRTQGVKTKFVEAKTLEEATIFAETYLARNCNYDVELALKYKHTPKNVVEMLRKANIINKYLTDLRNAFPNVPRVNILSINLSDNNCRFNRDNGDNIIGVAKIDTTISIGKKFKSGDKKYLSEIISETIKNINTAKNDIVTANNDIKFKEDNIGKLKAGKSVDDAKLLIDSAKFYVKSREAYITRATGRINNIQTIQLEHKQKKEIYNHHNEHSLFCHPFTEEGAIKGAINHEFGHAIHTAYRSTIDTLFDSIEKDTEKLILSPNGYVKVPKVKTGTLYPTQRSSDNREESVAECFSLYVIGKQNDIDPKIVDMFDKIRVGKV